jgi:hypothetical protein
MSDGTQFILILGLMAGLTFALAWAFGVGLPPRTPTTFKEEFKEIVSGFVGSLALTLVGIGVWVWWSGGLQNSSHVPDFSNAPSDSEVTLCVQK